MTELEQATRRLEAALDRLERAADSADPARLRAALDAARDETGRLRTLTRSVAARLDDTIGRLKTALES